MINFVPMATGLNADGSPDAALIQAMAARKKAQQQGLTTGQSLSRAASSTDPIYKPALGYAKLMAGALGGFLEGRDERAKAEATKQSAMSASQLAGSLGLTPDQQKQLQAMMLTNPEAAIAIVKQMTERLFAKPEDRFTQFERDGSLYQKGSVSGSVSKIGDAQRPTHGVIGQDQFGRPQYGFIDPGRQSVTPTQAPGTQAAGASTIPAAPPGVDPVIWNQEQSKRAAAQGMPAAPDDVANLRKEIQSLPSYKNIAQAAPIYKSMFEAASRNTKASDLNLVYGLGKIMDPTSVVREGEMLMVKNAAGLSEQVLGAINALNGGAALTPETRMALMKEAQGRMQSYKDLFDQDVAQYQGIAERGRMNAADVIPQFGPVEPFEQAGPPIPQDLQAQIAAGRQQSQAAAPAQNGLTLDMIEAEIQRRQQKQQQPQAPQPFVDPMGGTY